MDDTHRHMTCSNQLASLGASEMSGGKVQEKSPGLVTGYIPIGDSVIHQMKDRIDISGIPSKDSPPPSKMTLKSVYRFARTVIGKDDRQQVIDTTLWPWSTVCSLLLKWGEKEYIGTGSLIGPDTVMTCGHNLYDKADGGWATEITVMPGRNGESLPFGYLVTDRFFSVDGWVSDADPTCDYGCIKLPKSFREASARDPGWIGYGIFSDAEIRKQTEMRVSGYPADKKQYPGTMWYAEGRISKVTTNKISYKLDTYKGESGSPVWMTWEDEKPYIVGIHNYGENFSNKATRISKSVYENMLAWADM